MVCVTFNILLILSTMRMLYTGTAMLNVRMLPSFKHVLVRHITRTLEAFRRKLIYNITFYFLTGNLPRTS